jgi:tetratricopeptide (TPR) repeat protein
MRRLAIVSAMAAGLLLAGCAGQQSTELNDGWSMIVAEEFTASRAHYQSLLADDPNNPYVNRNLGVSYEETGDNELAAKHYQVALANGKDSRVSEVAQDGNTAPRQTTVAQVATENLRCLGANICQAIR